MKPNVFSTPRELAAYVGAYWQSLQNSSAADLFTVAVPLSSTPLPLYTWVLDRSGDVKSWENFRFVMMDEQIEEGSPLRYVSSSDPASYENFARRHFFDQLVTKTSLNYEDILIRPDLRDLRSADNFLERHGGFDLLVLAYGTDGHYAHVMPGVEAERGYHVADLSTVLADAHTYTGSLSFPGAQFRTRGMSLGPKQVVGAKSVVVMASGDSKRDATERLLAGTKFDPAFPISIIHHPDVVKKVQLCVTADTVRG